MIHLINEIYAVELTILGDQFKSLRILEPDKKWSVPYLKYSYRSIYHTKNFGRDFYCSEEEPLEVGNWQLICTTKECTQMEARYIIGCSEWFFPERHTRYIDYTQPYDAEGKQAWSVGFSDPLESLRSLLASKGLDVNKNYVLIKKVS